MKKLLCILLLALLPFAAAAETADLNSLTLEELLLLNQQTTELLTEAVLQKTRTDLQAATTDNGLVMADNGQEVMVRAYKGSAAEVVIPAEYKGMPVTRIGEKAFYQNKLITSVVLPDTLTYIGEYAFFDCENLHSINLDYVSHIGDDAFSDAGLTGVQVLRADSLVLGSSAFRYSTLSGIRILSDSVYLDGLYTFVNMNELQYIFFARDTVITTDRGSNGHITYCNKLETVILPENVSFSSKDEFSGCVGVTIYAPEGSSAAAYAREQFLILNTEEYENMYSLFETAD